MSIFYPVMGIDIVAPLMAVPKAHKIITLGPVDTKRFGNKGSVDKTMNYITQLMMYGSNGFENPAETVEFFPDIGEKLKTYNFKKLKMYQLMYRKHDQQNVSVSYYYDARITDNSLPFKEKVDYVFHKDFEMTPQLKQNLKSIIHSGTMLIGTEDDLVRDWGVKEDVLDNQEFLDTYDIRKDRDQYLFQVNINDYL